MCRTRRQRRRCEFRPEKFLQKEALVRTSPRILGALERVLTRPSWKYCTIWYYPVFVLSASRRPPVSDPPGPQRASEGIVPAARDLLA
jgi:hypothetical protein